MKFGTYPYTTARMKAMKSLLLARDDYIKMRKMGLNEMIRYLEEREYKKEITLLSAEYKRMELINLALNENLANTINKLFMISSKESHVLIKNYSMKWIINNIKIIIRSKNWDLVKKAIVPIAPTTHSYCFDLIRKEKNEFVKEVSKVTGIDEEKFMDLYENNDIIGMENELDRLYYSGLVLVHKELGRGVLKDFYKFLIELMDIKNVIKLKSIKVQKEVIESLVTTKSPLVKQIIGESMEDSIKTLNESKYKAFAEGVEKDLSQLENNIEKYLLQYSFKLLHLKPLSIAPIFGYLLAKEIEIRNLKLLINSRAVNLDEEFVEKNLITE